MLFLVATTTPFDRKGRVDHGRLRAHVLWLAAKGVDGFVPTGTTGEFLYLSSQEREAVHRTVLDAARGRPVYPCCWDPSPITTAYLADAARDNGASGVLMPPPLYYKVDDRVVLDGYRRLHEVVDLPLLAYHNPKYLRTGVTAETYATLRKEEVVVGLKDSSQDRFRLDRLSRADPGCVYAGGDRILEHAGRIPFLGGFISGAGNVWPDLCLRIWRGGEHQLAEALQDRLDRVEQGGGIRAYKSMLGMGCRFPLPEPTSAQRQQLPEAEWEG